MSENKLVIENEFIINFWIYIIEKIWYLIDIYN